MLFYMAPMTVFVLECFFWIFVGLIVFWFLLRCMAKRYKTIACNNYHCHHSFFPSRFLRLNQRCKFCICYEDRCDNIVVPNGYFCIEHTCRRFKCLNGINPTSARHYCSYHSCAFVDPHSKDSSACDVQLLNGQTCCPEHMCTQPGCNRVAMQYVAIKGESVLRCWVCTLCVFDGCGNTRLARSDVCKHHSKPFQQLLPRYDDLV